MKYKIMAAVLIVITVLLFTACGEDPFYIEGKWENTGDTGFGQVQPGSIIVFDGANCNFYSPKDTYAITEDGDGDYSLTVTGMLSSDSMTFTVHVDDNDHITITGGSDDLTLERRQ